MTCQAGCCRDMRLLPLHLLFPEQMPIEGQIFVHAHGLDFATLRELRRGAVLEPDGQVKIQHVCDHLTADNRCDIYETRPQICRDFDCSTRPDHVSPDVPVPLIFRKGTVN